MEKLDLDKWFNLNHAMKHDEECLKVRRTKWKTRLALLIFVCAAAAAFLLKYYILTGILGAVAVVLLLVALKQLQYKPKEYLPFVYSEGNPAAAVISKENPLTVFALADLSQGNARPVYGLQRFHLKALPGHTVAAGERIPCAAVYKESKERSGQFLTYRLHPYCWATDKMAAVQAWEYTIPKLEWRLLEDSVANFYNLEEDEIIELRQDGIPLGRRRRHSEQLELFATPEMEQAHPKVYPEVGKMIGRDVVIQIYNQFIATAAACQVYEYFCEPDPNSFLMTLFNCPNDFAKHSGSNKNALARDEVALIYFADNTLLTTLGIWRKGAFRPWKDVSIEVRPVIAGKLKISMNGRSSVIISCKKEFYTAPVTDQELHALETKRMARFLEKLKDLSAAITEEVS